MGCFIPRHGCSKLLDTAWCFTDLATSLALASQRTRRTLRSRGLGWTRPKPKLNGACEMNSMTSGTMKTIAAPRYHCRKPSGSACCAIMALGPTPTKLTLDECGDKPEDLQLTLKP